jgi:hypothetical protein
MEILSQAERLLRKGGYRVRLLPAPPTQVLCFEDDVAIGFLRLFETAAALIETWRDLERSDIVRHALQLRSAPRKAWNVYSLLLTAAPVSPSQVAEIDRIEEDFSSTRKIVRGGITSPVDLEQALLPLLPLRSLTTVVSASDYEGRLRSHLNFLPEELLDGVLRNMPPGEIVRRMGETQ